MPSPSSVTLVSKCTVVPHHKSSMGDLKLSVSDLPMLSCHYIQKGNLFSLPLNTPFSVPMDVLKLALSKTLTHFPPLAGRLSTDSPSGYVYLTCNDAGADFLHAHASHISVSDVISPIHVPGFVNDFFAFDRTVSYHGHSLPILAVQVTELADGVFVGCTVNHAVVDGTSFWNFFNAFAEATRGVSRISRPPKFNRDSVLISQATLRFPDGGPDVTFSADAPLAERIFRFSRDSILKLKATVNNSINHSVMSNNAVEIIGKQSNDTWKVPDGKVTAILDSLFRKNAVANPQTESLEISSFQSLCALLWRVVTRARKLPLTKTTTFRMAVNCRHRLEPKLHPLYFGNAIQSIPTEASAGEVLCGTLKLCAERLNRSVNAHDDATVRRSVEEWERKPRCFPLGNFDGAMITMGSSPRFPMYDNDFGWGRPTAVRSGRANKFDGKISAFPGREGGGSVDLEVCLSPETMAGLENDSEFMQYVTV